MKNLLLAFVFSLMVLPFSTPAVAAVDDTVLTENGDDKKDGKDDEEDEEDVFGPVMG